MAKKIKVSIFDDMKAALRDAAAYERGGAVNLRVTRIPSRPKQISAKEVRHILEVLNASLACSGLGTSQGWGVCIFEGGSCEWMR